MSAPLYTLGARGAAPAFGVVNGESEGCIFKSTAEGPRDGEDGERRIYSGVPSPLAFSCLAVRPIYLEALEPEVI